MDLWDSPVRVMWDPDGIRYVLVPYGAPMWAPLRIDGGQEVQVIAPIRAAGVANHPRLLESHRLDFSIARETATVEAAIVAGLVNLLQLPRTMADVLLSFQSGRQFRVKNCAVQRWPQDYDPQFDHVARESVVILGGEIVADEGTYTPGDTWGEMPTMTLLTEAGDGLTTEGGDYLTEEDDP